MVGEIKRQMNRLQDEMSSPVRTTRAVDGKKLLDLLPAYICYLGQDFRFQYANNAYAAFRKRSPEAIIGQHCSDIVGPQSFEILRKRLSKALNGEAVSFEHDISDGSSLKRVRTDLLPDRDAEGVVQGVLATAIELNVNPALKARLADSEALFDEAFGNSPIGMALIETGGRLVRANRPFTSMLGRSEQDLVGKDLREITYRDDVNTDAEVLREVLSGHREGYKIDKRYLRGDGAVVEAAISVSAMRNAAGDIVRFIYQVEDVTERNRAQRALQERNAQLSLAMDVVRGGFWHFDIAKMSFGTSDGLTHYIAGSESASLSLKEYVARMNPEDRANADFSVLLNGTVERNSTEYRLDTIRGVRWMRCDRQLLRDDFGQATRIVGVAIDITDERDKIAESEQLAESDSLTSLPNRRGLWKRMRGMQGKDYALMLLDLDGFKAVNDRLGHRAGDHVLVETAKRLRSAVREKAFVARLGGDEFVVLLKDEGTTEPLEALAGEINLAVRERIFFEGEFISVGCSIGISRSPGTVDADAALARADEMLYKAKAAGKNTWRIASN